MLHSQLIKVVIPLALYSITRKLIYTGTASSPVDRLFQHSTLIIAYHCCHSLWDTGMINWRIDHDFAKSHEQWKNYLCMSCQQRPAKHILSSTCLLIFASIIVKRIDTDWAKLVPQWKDCATSPYAACSTGNGLLLIRYVMC
jgi:hypothetical protein